MDKFIAEESLKEIQMLNKFKKYIKSKEYINRLGIEDEIDKDLKSYRKCRKRALNNIREGEKDV